MWASVQLMQTPCLLDIRRFSWAPSIGAQIPPGSHRMNEAMCGSLAMGSPLQLLSWLTGLSDLTSKSPETLDSCYSSSLLLSVLLDVDKDPSSSRSCKGKAPQRPPIPPRETWSRQWPLFIPATYLYLSSTCLVSSLKSPL